jgi:hypothetical protein
LQENIYVFYNPKVGGAEPKEIIRKEKSQEEKL